MLMMVGVNLAKLRTKNSTMMKIFTLMSYLSMKDLGSNFGMMIIWWPPVRGCNTFMVSPKMWNIGMTDNMER